MNYSLVLRANDYFGKYWVLTLVKGIFERKYIQYQSIYATHKHIQVAFHLFSTF